MSHWSSKYIGLPWGAGGRTREAIDCYGLAVLVYQEVLGIELPSYDEGYVTADEREDIAELIAGGTARGPWNDVAISDAKEFDGIILRRGGFASHIGIVVDRGLMLHATSGKTSCVERYLDGRWRPAIACVLRHRSRA